MWIILSLVVSMTGQLPPGISQSGHTTAVVFATDLIFLVAPSFIAARLLLHKNPWGALMAGTILVKCLLYPLVLVLGGLLAYGKTGIYDPLTPLYIILGIGCFFCLYALLRGAEDGACKHLFSDDRFP
ncbi:hypothetical protein [Chitinivibrio alkaliphilus]|uniref:Uncharacterized protein n=1 Tax=Chitinivibrio alkaliphilus ACht1 TaxID=1313304 RepID=U7D541_9BACT|nr:hypothetical protein [Chitinivibrio alkaliphilus]ERP30686.1 hypothetical protein CALK_2505 [Chitinivibrio alkaliphilus ACht1]